MFNNSKIVSINSSTSNNVTDKTFKITLIVKYNSNGEMEVLSSSSELMVNYNDKNVVIKKEKYQERVKYNPLMGSMLNKIKEEFNNVELVETSVYVGVKIGKHTRYDLILTPMAKNCVKIDLPQEFLQLINSEYQINKVFGYMGQKKIEKLNDFYVLLKDYKDYLEMI